MSTKEEIQTPVLDEMMQDPDFVTLVRRKLFEHDTAASQNTESDAVRQAREMARAKKKVANDLKRMQEKYQK